MKKLKKLALVLTSALLVMVMAIGLVACGKSNSIKKAFEKEGYTVTTVNKDSNELTKSIFEGASEENKKILEKSELISVSKGLNAGVIIKFPSTKDLKEYAGDNYDKSVESGLVNGECVLVSLSPEVVKIFKNA